MTLGSSLDPTASTLIDISRLLSECLRVSSLVVQVILDVILRKVLNITIQNNTLRLTPRITLCAAHPESGFQTSHSYSGSH